MPIRSDRVTTWTALSNVFAAKHVGLGRRLSAFLPCLFFQSLR